MPAEILTESGTLLLPPQEALAHISSTNRFARIVIDVLRKGAVFKDQKAELTRHYNRSIRNFRDLLRFDCEVPIGDSDQTAHIAIVSERTPKESKSFPLTDGVVDFFLSPTKSAGFRGSHKLAQITTSPDKISLPEFRFDLSSNFGKFATDFIARLAARLNEIREDISGDPTQTPLAEPNPS
ncbi:MAG: hypothetical protein U1C56_00440 [Candidatus Curtissbacteria bacterium]|nr:hypothetical protein [Candidatus Curtissbacteria bacterium]